MARLPDEHQETTPRQRPLSAWRDLSKTLVAVLIGVGLFLASYLVLGGQPLSEQERVEFFGYVVGVPVILDMCAERSYGDVPALRAASRKATRLLREARDRSAAGVVPLPPGGVMSDELERLMPEMVGDLQTVFRDRGMTTVQWRKMCDEFVVDFRSDDTGWAHLQRKYPRQVRKLDLSRP